MSTTYDFLLSQYSRIQRSKCTLYYFPSQANKAMFENNERIIPSLFIFLVGVVWSIICTKPASEMPTRYGQVLRNSVDDALSVNTVDEFVKNRVMEGSRRGATQLGMIPRSSIMLRRTKQLTPRVNELNVDPRETQLLYNYLCNYGSTG